MKKTSTTVVLALLALTSFGQRIDSLTQQLKNASNEEKPQILIELCDANMNFDNNAALSYSEDAIQASEAVNDSASLAKACVMKGELLTEFDRYIEARSCLERSLSIASAMKNQYMLSDIHGALGGLYYSLLNHEKALYHYKLGTDLAKQIGDYRLLAKNMNNMAGLFEVQGKYELALRAFEECSAALEGTALEGQRFYYITLLNSGMVCNSMEDYKKAIHYLKRAVNGFEVLKTKGLEAHALVGLVHSYTKLGKLDSALSYYRHTLSLNKEFEMGYRKHFRDQTYVELLFEMKRYGEVISLTKSKLNEIGEDSSQAVFAGNAAKLIYETYKILGNDEQALSYLELYNKYNDYSQSQATENEVKALRTRFETELDFEAKSREVIEFQLRDKLQKEEIDKQKNLRNFILAIAVLALVISGLILNSLKLQKRASEAESNRLEVDNSKLQMEIEHKNRELTSTAMFVAEKNQMLLNLQDDLIKLGKSDKNLSNKDFRAIQSQIKDNIRLEDDWENIKLHFDEVYPDFFAKLKSAHPQLTPLELKHCAYLRMSLSVKEVARMLSVAPKSVQMGHYRLKKKMGLGVDDKLRTYLSGF